MNHKDFEKALALHNAGKLKEAELIYRRILKKFPAHADTLHLLGTIEVQLGHFQEAKALLERAISTNPNFAHAINSLGLAYAGLGDKAKARELYLRSMEIAPDYPDPYNNMSNLLIGQNNPKEAETYARRALEISPNSELSNFSVGEVLKSQDRYEEAAQYYRRGVEINPKSTTGLNNLGSIYKMWGRYEEALVFLDRCVKIDPDMYAAQSNLGGVLEELERFEEAYDAYQRAIDLNPNDTVPKWNCSLLYLKRGIMDKGWEYYETRFSIDEAKQTFPYPVWDGSPLEGKKLLVYAEQGMGDEFLFASCIPDLLATGADCIIQCDIRLETLFARSFPGALVKGSFRNDPYWASPDAPKADLQLSIGSLPKLFRPTLESFPDRNSFLAADDVRVDYWRSRLSMLGPGLKIGICWRSSLSTGERSKFYSSLSQWGEIFGVAGVHFVNLQYDECTEELNEARAKFGIDIAHYPELDMRNNIDETAALIKSMDLVISAGTSVVNIAAGLGIESWRLDASKSWAALGTDRMPWYPSMKLFIKDTLGDWDLPISMIAQALREKVAGHERIFEYVELPSRAQLAVEGSFENMPTYVTREQLGWFDPEYAFFVGLSGTESNFIDAGAGIGTWSVPMAWQGGRTWALTQTVEETGLILNSRKKNGLDRKIEVAIAYSISLDFLMNRYGLENIDLLRVAQDFSTPELVDKGARFFSLNSPLVLFGIRHGSQLDLSLAERFQAEGFGLYRYIPGLKTLVPFANASELDAFSLNLFACKDDRAEHLEREGKLVRTVPAIESYPGIDQMLWQKHLKSMPYAEELSAAWNEPNHAAWEVYWMALNLYAMASSPERSMAERVACLKAASGVMETLVKDAANLPRLASLARMLNDSGRREVTVHLLNHVLGLLESGNPLSLDEPFLTLAEIYEKTDPGVKPAEWFVSMILEQRDRLRAFSSYFTGYESLPVLQEIEQSGFLSEDMERRLALLRKRFEAAQA